ncbi:MAG TPA: hypothetical protein VH640_22890 [Bryobacteraceae bacterium]
MLLKTLRICAVLFAGTAASVLFAQYGPPEGPYAPDAVRSLVDRVHNDLNHGYSVWNLHSGDRDRLNHAERDLRSFSRDWEHGRFDRGDLDSSIGAIQHVLDENRLRGGERDALSADVGQLRHLREAYNRHEIGNWEQHH